MLNNISCAMAMHSLHDWATTKYKATNLIILQLEDNFNYFDIGRWDLILKNNRVIKLPVRNFTNSLKNYLELNKEINFVSSLIHMPKKFKNGNPK